MADRRKPAILLSLAELVDELLVRFVADDDVPADHRCTTAGARVRCSHDDVAGQPLLERLRELIVPGTAPAKENPGPTPGGKQHSPAPWDRKPGELVDEVLRGSLDLNARARRVLGFTPLTVTYRVAVPMPEGWHPPLAPWPATEAMLVPAAKAPLEDAGPAALRDLVRLLPLLRDRGAALGDWQPIEDAPSWEQPIEPAVRSWHQQALLITGHERPWPRVTQVPNPDHPDNAPLGAFLLGPACPACRHRSCRLLRDARRTRWVQARCPHCRSSSLRQNPVTQSIECQRPSCTDDRGRRHVWTIAALRELGLVNETAVSA